MELNSLKIKYALDVPIHAIDFIRHSPSSLPSINNFNSNISINLPKEDAYICSQNYHLTLELEVLKNENTRYVDNDQICLINFGHVALFS